MQLLDIAVLLMWRGAILDRHWTDISTFPERVGMDDTNKKDLLLVRVRIRVSVMVRVIVSNVCVGKGKDSTSALVSQVFFLRAS